MPFRFTPNIQDYITPVGVEGLFTSCLMATARSLTEPELDLEQYLSLFIRDELITWHTSNHRTVTDAQFRDRVQTNVGQAMAKAQFMSCRVENNTVSRSLLPTDVLLKLSLHFSRILAQTNLLLKI